LLREVPKLKAPDILWGSYGQQQVAEESGAAVVLSAIVGGAGLGPTLGAVKKGLKVALANKESLVLGGEIIMAEAKKSGAFMAPVDSEHSAIFQALGGQLTASGLRRLILTASGGPLLGMSAAEIETVGKAQVLAHPRWRMGPKITCDSASMMNKGLEVIEAHHLFGLSYDKIEVLVHPQSVVHSLVEFCDGSQIAQLGPTDMRLAIAYALSCPDRWPLLPLGPTHKGLGPSFAPLDLAKGEGKLSFEKPDRQTFKALELAETAGRTGGTAPAILSGANEQAVEMFLAGAISFADIIPLVDQALNILPSKGLSCIEEAIEAEAQARFLVKELVTGKNHRHMGD
ncbi:MAG: 1-deoxy-D-xylulose-5-phosphate reductoisomerase, partial [Candidatus Adiutrix sp.]